MGRLADLAVYDRTEGRRLPVYWHQGRAYVVGKPGNEYQLSLRNRAGDDVLAIVSVDGVNVITGQSASPQQSGYVLAPRGGIDILGWRKNLSETAAFYFTPLPDSYAARTGRPDDVGVIGVALFRKKSAAARRHPLARHSRARALPTGHVPRQPRPAESQLGTGHGRRETSHAQYVNFERATSAPGRDGHALLRQPPQPGGARHHSRAAPVAPLPWPRPFPGFVPDRGA